MFRAKKHFKNHEVLLIRPVPYAYHYLGVSQITLLTSYRSSLLFVAKSVHTGSLMELLDMHSIRWVSKIWDINYTEVHEWIISIPITTCVDRYVLLTRNFV